MSDLIDTILEWAEEHPVFDGTFVLAMQERRDNGHELSWNMESALAHIYASYKIGKWVADREAQVLHEREWQRLLDENGEASA